MQCDPLEGNGSWSLGFPGHVTDQGPPTQTWPISWLLFDVLIIKFRQETVTEHAKPCVSTAADSDKPTSAKTGAPY